MLKGSHHTEKTKNKIRLAELGRKLPEAQRLKVIKTLNHGKGKDNPAWKGGRTIKYENGISDKVKGVKGYVLLKLPNHPGAYRNRYYPEHRYVMEQKIGRLLTNHEVVHHINGIKDDNRIENLVLINASTHSLITTMESEINKLKEENRQLKEKIKEYN